MKGRSMWHAWQKREWFQAYNRETLRKKVTRCSWDGAIEMDLKERGWKGVNWNHLILNGISRGPL